LAAPPEIGVGVDHDRDEQFAFGRHLRRRGPRDAALLGKGGGDAWTRIAHVHFIALAAQRGRNASAHRAQANESCFIHGGSKESVEQRLRLRLERRMLATALVLGRPA
jgi:hypothetical protein